MSLGDQQSMQNWKRQIILDPHLNSLFDSSVYPQTFLNTKILTLPQPTIVQLYIKLTSLRHAITKNIQKEIELKAKKIQQSFRDNYETKKSYEGIDHQQLTTALKNIQKFNEKYEMIQGNVGVYKNINAVLHFAAGLEKFKVKVRYLRNTARELQVGQGKDSKIVTGMLNSVKVSKILKEISEITLRYDFSGIKSFEEQRHYINNIRGSFFGLIQKELTSTLLQLPNQPKEKRQNIISQISNKLIVLSNIGKLKDFCVPFFKTVMREMSQLLKKCLGGGISAQQSDPSSCILIFEQYFVHSVRRKIIQSSQVFVVLQQLVAQNNIKAGFISNFFQKYWQNLCQFIHDMIAWSIDNQGKQWIKQKSTQNLYQSFNQSKNGLNKYLTSILWKYPILFDQLSGIANQVHGYLIKYTHYHHYQFGGMKEALVKELLPLGRLYYQHAGNFVSLWKNKVKKIGKEIQEDKVGGQQNFPLGLVVALFENTKATNEDNISFTFRIWQWLTFNIKINQIYEFYTEQLISILEEYFGILKKVLSMYDPQKHNSEDWRGFITKAKSFYNQAKEMLLRKGNKGDFDVKQTEKGLLVTHSEQLIKLIQRFRKYTRFIEESQTKIAMIVENA